MKNLLKIEALLVFLLACMPLFSSEKSWDIVLVWDDLNGLIYEGLNNGISLTKKYSVYDDGNYLGEFLITELGEDYSKGILKPIDKKFSLKIGNIVSEFREEKQKQKKEVFNLKNENEKVEEKKEEIIDDYKKELNYEYFSENIGTSFFNILNQKNVEWRQERINTINSDAKIFVKAGLLKEAIKLYEEGIDLDKNNVIFYNNLALIYISLNDFEKALDYLLKAIKLSPKDYVLHRNLSIVYLKMGLFLEATNEILESKKLGDPYSEKVISLIKKFMSSQ